MGWIGNFFFCLGTMTVTGSVSFLIYLITRFFFRGKAPRLLLWMARVTVLLYLVPVVYMMLWINNWHYSKSAWAHMGEFSITNSPIALLIYWLIAFIWPTGLIVSTIYHLSKYIGLRKLLNENGPVMDERWERLIYENCGRYAIERPPVYQNVHIRTPFVVRLYRHLTIILPMKGYTELQMRMMMDHEVNHIRSNDVRWEELVNIVVWLHCINPLVYFLRHRLLREQEVECDFFVCQNSSSYTAQEYFGFMEELSVEVENKNMFMMALFESKSEITERMEEIEMRSKTQKASKWVILVSCMVMCLCSVGTAYAMADEVTGIEEDLVYQTERIHMGSSEMDDHEELYFVETEGSAIREVFLDEETMPYSSYIQVGITIPAQTRTYWKLQHMVVGDLVTMTVYCQGKGLYWIGIKEVNTGDVYCIEGTGTLTHTFSVQVEGNYRAFVHNKSDNAEYFQGSIIYPY